MKIISVKNPKNVLACAIAMELCITNILGLSYMESKTEFGKETITGLNNFSISPYLPERKYEFKQSLGYENNNLSRKRAKKNSNPYDSSYYRNARNSLNKPNYF